MEGVQGPVPPPGYREDYLGPVINPQEGVPGPGYQPAGGGGVKPGLLRAREWRRN